MDLLCRLFLAGVFLTASFGKFRQPKIFLRSVLEFKLMPAPLVLAAAPLPTPPAQASVASSSAPGTAEGVSATNPLPVIAPTAARAAPLGAGAAGGWYGRSARLGRALRHLVARGARTSIR